MYFVFDEKKKKSHSLMQFWSTLKRSFHLYPCWWHVFSRMKKRSEPWKWKLYPTYSFIVLLRWKNDRVRPYSSSRTSVKVPGQAILMFARRKLVLLCNVLISVGGYDQIWSCKPFRQLPEHSRLQILTDFTALAKAHKNPVTDLMQAESIKWVHLFRREHICL